MMVVERKDKIVLDANAVYCLHKELKEFRQSLDITEENSLELMKMSVKEKILNDILKHGSDYPFVEMKIIQDKVNEKALREKAVEHLKETEDE